MDIENGKPFFTSRTPNDARLHRADVFKELDKLLLEQEVVGLRLGLVRACAKLDVPNGGGPRIEHNSPQRIDKTLEPTMTEPLKASHKLALGISQILR